METYRAMRDRHGDEVNSFPMVFAFGDKQFIAAMAKLGLTPEDTDKVYSFGDTGGIYLKSDAPILHEMLGRHERERQAAIAGDTTGNGYIFDMFRIELRKHEFIITRDTSDTLEFLGITFEEVEADKRLKHGLNKAIKKVLRGVK
jgi:hypothetical protein